MRCTRGKNALVAAYTTSLKFGWVKPKGGLLRLVPLADSSTILQLTIGWIATVLFFVVALRLVRRKPAFVYYTAALVLSSGNWFILKLGTVYDRVFTRSEQNLDYVLLAILVLFGSAIWLIERGRPRSAKA